MTKVEVKQRKKYGFALYVNGIFIGVAKTREAASKVGSLIAGLVSDGYDNGYIDGHYEGYDQGVSDASEGGQ